MCFSSQKIIETLYKFRVDCLERIQFYIRLPLALRDYFYEVVICDEKFDFKFVIYLDIICLDLLF